MLRQSLKSLGTDTPVLCEKAAIEPTLRAEQCDLAAFARLARAYVASVQSTPTNAVSST